MAGFFDYFNGSKYYRKRNQYRIELFNNAKKVIEKYKLKVPLYDETFIRPLTDKESTLLQQDRESLRNTIKLVDGYGSSSRVVFYNDSAFTLLPENYVQITKLGLKHYTDILAELKARSETHYATDLIDPAVIAGIVAGYLLGIALSCVPFMQAIGASTAAAAYMGLVTAVISMLLYIKKLGDDAALQSLQYEVISHKVATSYASYSNYYMSHKKLQAGKDSMLYGGYEIYANGQSYQAETAGSESFKPTQAYNPTQNFAPLHKTQNKTLDNIDERTQGRAHYNLAGNDGYMDKIAPFPLEKIKELDNDMEYKLNFLKQHNQRLIEGYSRLAQFTGSNEEYYSGEWIQAVYNADYRTYKDNYYDYVESKDFINQVRTYNQALRFKGEFYSRSVDERKWIKVSKKVDVPNIDVNEPSIDETPADPIAVYEDCIRNFFYEERRELGDMEEWIEQNGEFDKSKAEWRQSERKMLESLSLDKYWEYLLALKAIDDNTIGDWVGKAIEAGYLESVVHQYFMAKSEKLEVSDYTQQEQERFEIGDVKLVYMYPPKIPDNLQWVTYTKQQWHIFIPYGIFFKTFCDRQFFGELRASYDNENAPSYYWYPAIYYQNIPVPPNHHHYQFYKARAEEEKAKYLNPIRARYNYQPINYKDITQKVLHTYMPKCKDFLGKEFMQTSFKILCNRQVEF